MKRKELERLMSKEELDEFDNWIKGQTVGLDKNGKIDYYEWDVKKFLNILKHRKHNNLYL